MAQKYVALPTGKTIADLFATPAMALQYSDDNTMPLPAGFSWVINDTAQLDALAAAQQPGV